MPNFDAHEDHLVLGSLRTTASHTIGVPHLIEVLRAVPTDAPQACYREVIVDENLLGRPTQAGRQRTFRHLRELYFLNPSRREFLALRRLGLLDAAAQPLMAGILSFTRDSVFRASFHAVQQAPVGAIVTSDDLAKAVAAVHWADFSAETLAKTGRNTAASWTQTGHLAGRTKKVRQRVIATPAAVAYAAYLGYLAGKRGVGVLSTPWSALLDLPAGSALDALRSAHAHGLIDLLIAGNVVDVSFPLVEGGHC